MNSNEDMQGLAVSQSEPHLRDYLRIIYVRRWTLISVFVAITLTTLVWVLAQVPIYRATCVLLMQPTRQKVLDIKEVYDQTLGAESGRLLRREFMDTHSQLLKSRSIAERTFLALGFDKLPEFQGMRDPVEPFSGLYSMKAVGNTYLVEVAFEWKDPEVAARALEHLVEQYLKACRERALGVTEGGLEALRAKGEEMRPALEAKYGELEAFMAAENILSLDESQGLVMERLKELRSDVTKAEAECLKAEGRHLRASKAIEDGIPQAIPEFRQSRVVQDLKLERGRASLQYNDLVNRLGPSHRDARLALMALNMVSENLDLEARDALASIEAEYRRAKEELEGLQGLLAEQEKRIVESNRSAAKLRVLKDEHAALLRSYNAVIQRIEEIQLALAAGSKEDRVFVVQPPKVPASPAKPRKRFTMFMAAFMGLAMGVGLCFFLDYLDTSVKTKEDVEALIGASVLGHVPAFADGKMDAGELPMELTALRKPRSHPAEAFRTIRTALSFTCTGSGCHHLIVSSALPSEGKTLVSVNVALSLAQSGKRTLLVDADLRKPRVHKVLQMDSAPGLSNLLAGQEGISLDAVIRSTQVENLSAIPSGPVPPNPSELIAGPRILELMKEFSGRFDYVVFDTPPVISVTDAVALAQHVSGALLVVRAFATDRSALRHAYHLLTSSGTKLMGIVLNGVDTPRGGYYYGGGYYYSRYYRGYYRGYYGKEAEEDKAPPPAPEST